jgi:hypothetical protein
MSPEEALDAWKARAGWEGSPMLHQCIELYHHGIFLPYKAPKHHVYAVEVGFGGFDTPASQSGVGAMLLTHYCELVDAI